jgi:hypothetical protein
MALIKFGGGVAGISGKIGGTVFGRNKAGAYARNWAKPVNPVTPSQSQVRSIFGNASAAWGALIPAKRDVWNSYAATLERLNRFGEAYVPSGRQIFLESYNSNAQAGMAPLTDPIVGATPPPAAEGLVLTATVTAGVLTALGLAWTSPGSGSPQMLIIEATPPRPDTKTNVNNEYRQIAVEPTDGSPAVLLANYTSVFGNTATVGDVIRIRVTTLDGETSLRSAAVLASDIVA